MFKLANESSVPWKWWEYSTKFGEQCKMADNSYNEECAERVRPSRPCPVVGFCILVLCFRHAQKPVVMLSLGA